MFLFTLIQIFPLTLPSHFLSIGEDVPSVLPWLEIGFNRVRDVSIKEKISYFIQTIRLFYLCRYLMKVTMWVNVLMSY